MSIDELARRTGAVINEVARSRRPTVIIDHGHAGAAIVPIEEAAATPVRLSDLDERLGHQGGIAELGVEGESLVDELIADRRAEAAAAREHDG